jgi:acylphosphatase
VARKLILVRGLVQGIGYRWFVRETAERLKLAGWVRNLPNGDVEAEAQGAEASLKSLLAELKSGHRWAQVESLTSRDLPDDASLKGFAIR